MQLDEFVKTTLMQIAKGVKEAQSEALEYGAIINPPPVNNDSRPKATNVSFDVALTVSETSSGEAGGGLKVAAILSVGAKATETDLRQQTSRVQFQLNMTLPCAVEKEQYEPENNYENYTVPCGVG